jgi:hypothetical protein
MNRYCRSWLCMVACAVVLAAAPVRAAELDKFLPDDTQVIVSVNVRQILDSGLAKKYEIAKELEKQIAQSDEASKVLKSLGLDPLKDINRITVALPGKKDEKRMLVAITGSFDLAKIHDTADQHIKTHPDKLAVTKEGGMRLYEVKDQKGDKTETTFVTFLNKEVIVASPIKEYVMDAMAKSAGKKEAKFSKGLQELVAKQDAKQSFWVAALATEDMKAELANIPQTKQLSKNLESISAGVSLTTEIKLNVSAQTSDEATAKDVKVKLEGLRGVGVALVAGMDNLKDFAPMITDVLNAFKFGQEKGLASIDLTISADMIAKAAAMVKPPQ